ncbi:MAG TPA: hypothetical protein VGB82_06675 [Alphaproteobacteria bacterium]
MNSYLFLAFALACAAAYSAWRVRTEPKVARVPNRRRYFGWWACIVLATWLAICSTAIAFSPNM